MHHQFEESLVKIRTWGGVIVVVGLAVFLSRFFQGLGPGGGNGLGTGEASQAVSQEDLRTVSVNNSYPTATPAETAPGTGTEPSVVTVVIHDNSYRLALNAADPQTGLDVGLDVIATRALAVPGNKDGIRVRILLEKTAQEGARTELLQHLEQAGIKPEQIQELSGYVK